jgi:hypothetical protein
MASGSEFGVRGRAPNNYRDAQELKWRPGKIPSVSGLAGVKKRRPGPITLPEITRKLLASGIKDDEGNVDPDETFWVQASLAEALLGSGQKDEAAKLREELAKTAPAPWMVETMNDQLGKLEGLLAKVQ